MMSALDEFLAAHGKVHFHVADVSLRCHDNPIHVYHGLPLNKKSLHSFLAESAVGPTRRHTAGRMTNGKNATK